MKKLYYYYYRWWLAGDDESTEGNYHSTLVTEMKPAVFLANVWGREFIGEHFVKQFETEEEMKAYWDRVHS